MDSTSQTVIVTGASRGIGLGLATLLVDAGYRVVAIARRTSDPLNAAIAKHEAKVREANSRKYSPREARTGSLHFVPFDLQHHDKVPELIRSIRAEHGGLYGLVNNAGIGTEGILATMPMGDIERLVQLNTLAPMVMTKHVVRSMMSSGAGRIVNISSIIASTGYSGLSVYAATKASMIGFTKSLAREVGQLGITVNAVAPGFIDTELTASMDDKQRATIARRSALRRLASIEDVSQAVAYLMSERARNITGTVMTIDAGNTA